MNRLFTHPRRVAAESGVITDDHRMWYENSLHSVVRRAGMGDEQRGRLQVDVVGDSWCPIAATTSVVGRKWHPVIVHRLLEGGPAGFNELETRIGGISSKVLSESLVDLEANEIIEREVVSEHPVRVRYSLTEFGASLEPIVLAMHDWGTTRLEPPSEAPD